MSEWEPEESEWSLWGDRGRRTGCAPLVVLATVIAVPWIAVGAIVAAVIEVAR